LTDPWLLLQLADSAFPTGGFAHSGGLEAAFQLGLVTRARLGPFLAEALDHACATSLPVVAGVHREPASFGALDALTDAALSNHVANRASRAQGAALASTAASSFPLPELADFKARARRDASPTHLAPTFGYVSKTIGVHADDACRLFAFQTLRGFVSSAVRLGVVGPLEAQRLQHGLAASAEAVTRRHAARPPDALTQTNPLLELFQSHHDRLYSRLFSS
jgi:urease accessory protein